MPITIRSPLIPALIAILVAIIMVIAIRHGIPIHHLFGAMHLHGNPTSRSVALAYVYHHA